MRDPRAARAGVYQLDPKESDREMILRAFAFNTGWKVRARAAPSRALASAPAALASAILAPASAVLGAGPMALAQG